MKKVNKKRDDTTSFLIGTVVNELIAQGRPVSRDNILYELEKSKTTDAGFSAKAMAHEAAERLRRAYYKQ